MKKIPPKIESYIREVVTALRNGGFDDKSEFGKLYIKGEKILKELSAEEVKKPG